MEGEGPRCVGEFILRLMKGSLFAGLFSFKQTVVRKDICPESCDQEERREDYEDERVLMEVGAPGKGKIRSERIYDVAELIKIRFGVEDFAELYDQKVCTECRRERKPLPEGSNGRCECYNFKCQICESCKTQQTNTNVLLTTPEILIVQVNRKEGNGLGKTRHLYPIHINTRMTVESEENDPHQYQLKGIIDHLGTGITGHYIAYIWTHGKWIKYNDQEATEVTDIHTEVNVKTVSLLIYETDRGIETTETMKEGFIGPCKLDRTGKLMNTVMLAVKKSEQCIANMTAGRMRIQFDLLDPREKCDVLEMWKRKWNRIDSVKEKEIRQKCKEKN